MVVVEESRRGRWRGKGQEVMSGRRINLDRETHLPHIGNADRLPRLLSRLGKNRKEDGGQNRDDRDHHEQFDQRKCCCAYSPPTAASFPFHTIQLSLFPYLLKQTPILTQV